MWPLGDASRKYELGRTYIYNVGGNRAHGDYQVRVCRKNAKKNYDIAPRQIVEGGSGFARTGSVVNYPRKSYNVWRLVLRALRNCFPEEA